MIRFKRGDNPRWRVLQVYEPEQGFTYADITDLCAAVSHMRKHEKDMLRRAIERTDRVPKR